MPDSIGIAAIILASGIVIWLIKDDGKAEYTLQCPEFAEAMQQALDDMHKRRKE